jgi:hypothetical protein
VEGKDFRSAAFTLADISAESAQHIDIIILLLSKRAKIGDTDADMITIRNTDITMKTIS